MTLTTYETAHELQRRGYHVHRLCTPRHDCGSPGKVPHRRGWNTARHMTDRELARTFDVDEPPNIGVRITQGLVVLDCDIHEDDGGNGVLTLTALYEELGIETPPPTLVSGSGGIHLWVRAPRHAKLFCNPDLAPLVNTRTSGWNRSNDKKVGQVVVPPSAHKSGSPYVWWENELPPPLLDLPMIPLAFLHKLQWTPVETRSEHETSRAEQPVMSTDGWDKATSMYFAEVIDDLASTPPGGKGKRGRHEKLFAASCTARRLWNAVPPRSIPGDGALKMALTHAARACGITDPDDIARHIANGWSAAAGETLYPNRLSDRKSANTNQPTEPRQDRKAGPKKRAQPPQGRSSRPAAVANATPPCIHGVIGGHCEACAEESNWQGAQARRRQADQERVAAGKPRAFGSISENELAHRTAAAKAAEQGYPYCRACTSFTERGVTCACPPDAPDFDYKALEIPTSTLSA